MRVLEVHILNADRPAVGLAKGRYDLLQRGLLPEQCDWGMKRPVQVLPGEIKTSKSEQLMGVETPFQWVEAGHNVPQIAISINELLNSGLPQKFLLVAKTGAHLFGTAPKLEAVEENPPFATDALRVGFPFLILRIYKVCVEAQGVIHGQIILYGAALEKSWKTGAGFLRLSVISAKLLFIPGCAAQDISKTRGNDFSAQRCPAAISRPRQGRVGAVPQRSFGFSKKTVLS
jgi:hypothetical protein